MKFSRIVVVVLLPVVMTFAQTSRPLKMNLLTYFDKVPAPPTSCKQAHDRCDCEGRCTSDKIFQPLQDELLKLQSQMSSPQDVVQGDLMKKMQDPEFQKKLQKMSDEEKMKFAMEMQKSMTSTMKVESDDVIAALKEFSALNEARGNEMMNMSKTVEAQQKQAEALRAKHQAVDDWMAAEIKKLPLISSGEMSEHDPKAVFAVTMNAHKKHIAIVDDQLKVIGKDWAKEKAKLRNDYAKFEASLEKIHYGDDAANASTKTQLAGGQAMIITSVQGLLGESKTAFDDAANRYEQMVSYEKNNKP